MAVPNIFGSATSAIPLSQLDTNFATPVTIGNTAVQLGNTVTSFGNVTLTNVTISSGNVTITGANVSGTANVSTLIVTGNQTSLGNVAITGNISANIATFSAGSNTAPAITTTGDTNTGIFFPAADTIAFAEGGAEAMRIDSSGNVGIGTTSPAAKLDVRGSSSFLINATNPTAWVSVDSALTTGAMYNQWNTTSNVGITGTYTNHPHTFVTNNSERMRIDSSGNVGIGKSTITAKLDVQRTSGTTEPIGRFEAAVGSYTGTSLIAANTLGASSAYNLFSCISDSDGDAGGPFTEFSVRGDGLVFMDSGYGSAAAVYGCRAWVNFDGTGTVAIRGSGNVTSITDSGVGLYDVNFTTAMPDANYAVAVTAYSANSSVYAIGGQVNGQAPTTAKFRIAIGAGASFGADTTAGYADLPHIFASVFR